MHSLRGFHFLLALASELYPSKLRKARFHEASPLGVTSFQGGTNTGNLEFGGGIDAAPIIHMLGIPIGARIEVRDFYSGAPNFNAQLSGSGLNTVTYTGGLLLRF